MAPNTSRRMQDRAPHWIKPNHQTRMPKRWIAFDTESKVTRNGSEEIQTWSTGAAIRWRTDLKSGNALESDTFATPRLFWEYVSDYCRKGMRTVVAAHNLGHDIRISRALEILPALGFTLEWCNLDSNVSSMTWRSDHGTLVFMDTWTWLPLQLATIAPDVGLRKLSMPGENASRTKWDQYCMRDAEIVYRCVSALNDYIAREQLGNWQPTGAGMAYATWRHKFLEHNILVHDDTYALKAERAAMHTGRAEAWRHGIIMGDTWTEVDMRNAYTTIAAECDLPVKIKMRTGAITHSQYKRLSGIYRILALCDIDCDAPVAPYYTGTKTIWPVGTFRTWLWDTELEAMRQAGGTATIRDALCYTRAPILSSWANWVLSILRNSSEETSPVVKTWLKHCARALIGRIALRCPSWDYFGENPGGMTGISHETDAVTGITTRCMHIGNQTFHETGRTEGNDSLPQVTGWIMAECRSRLWKAISAAGQGQVAHVDTDSLLVSSTGLAALRAAEQERWQSHWAVKGSWRTLTVYGPRNYRCGKLRKTSGVPKSATETSPNVFTGERWHGMAADMGSGRSGSVTVETTTWHVRAGDPRRDDAPGAAGHTVPYQVAGGVVVMSSSSPKSGDGE